MAKVAKLFCINCGYFHFLTNACFPFLLPFLDRFLSKGDPSFFGPRCSGLNHNGIFWNFALNSTVCCSLVKFNGIFFLWRTTFFSFQAIHSVTFSQKLSITRIKVQIFEKVLESEFSKVSSKKWVLESESSKESSQKRVLKSEFSKVSSR
jgi:hypothetical protein